MSRFDESDYRWIEMTTPVKPYSSLKISDVEGITLPYTNGTPDIQSVNKCRKYGNITQNADETFASMFCY